MRPGALLSNDRGYATVASAGIIVAVVSLFLVVAGAVQVVVDKQRAEIAADLAAIAAATARYEGYDACAVATRTAGMNQARVESCTEHGADVIVTVQVGVRGYTSRAGPL